MLWFIFGAIAGCCVWVDRIEGTALWLPTQWTSICSVPEGEGWLHLGMCLTRRLLLAVCWCCSVCGVWEEYSSSPSAACPFLEQYPARLLRVRALVVDVFWLVWNSSSWLFGILLDLLGADERFPQLWGSITRSNCTALHILYACTSTYVLYLWGLRLSPSGAPISGSACENHGVVSWYVVFVWCLGQLLRWTLSSSLT